MGRGERLEEMSEGEGRYLYCIVNSSTKMSLGKIGIEDNEVYSIPYKDIGAVVHRCPAKPYDTKEEEKAGEWMIAHQYTIDAATKKFGTVLPFGFDTIIKGDEEKVQEWLSQDYPRLKRKLEKVKDKAEYGVQIFWDRNLVMQRIEETSEEIKRLKEEMKTKPEGIAYMLKRKSEKILKNGLVAKADLYSKDFYEEIKEHVNGIKVEETNKPVPEKWQDKEMIMCLACLVHNDKVENLGKVLEKINKMEGLSVRFTGPWAPFSFVRE